MKIQAKDMEQRTLNAHIRTASEREITVEGVCGQRYLGCGSSGQQLTIYGTPGNGLGHYLSGSTLEVFGNCQEAVGDTMDAGEIVIHGCCGDACGYGMRGGSIFIEGDVGYRAGIHMKSYMGKAPLLVVGGCAGSFLGEYLAGGLILVLGQGAEGKYPCGYFCGTGMHGGRIVLRCDEAPQGLPPQVLIHQMTDEERAEMLPHVQQYCQYFGGDAQQLMSGNFYVLTPNPKAGYKRMYTFE